MCEKLHTYIAANSALVFDLSSTPPPVHRPASASRPIFSLSLVVAFIPLKFPAVETMRTCHTHTIRGGLNHGRETAFVGGDKKKSTSIFSIQDEEQTADPLIKRGRETRDCVCIYSRQVGCKKQGQLALRVRACVRIIAFMIRSPPSFSVSATTAVSLQLLQREGAYYKETSERPKTAGKPQQP